jgi:hypothetical protein
MGLLELHLILINGNSQEKKINSHFLNDSNEKDMELRFDQEKNIAYIK